MKVKRRYFQLIEVMIALLLTVSLLVPLLKNHVHLYLQEKKMAEMDAIDHYAEIASSYLLYQLYSQKISWENLFSTLSQELKIDGEERWGPLPKISYTPFYSFSLKKQKGNHKETTDEYFLFTLHLSFNKDNQTEQNKIKKYEFDFFVEAKGC